MFKRNSLVFILVSLFVACSNTNDEQEIITETIDLISITLDGAPLISETENISTTPILRFVFSRKINAETFIEALSIMPNQDKIINSIDFQNNSSIVIIRLNLDYSTKYTIKLSGSIGSRSELLSKPLNYSFTSRISDIITSKQPCLDINNCKRTVSILKDSNQANFDFYSNYDIYENNAEWQELKKAVIVIHGASINPSDYYSYLTTTFEELNISNSTVLIAPHFKESQENAGDLYWNSIGYRDGKNSNSELQISSFEVLDKIINRIANKNLFPALNEIIITGQSSGGRFTHTFAAANRSESQYPDINFEYIVSESQYFYYPTSERVDEDSNNLYTPENCNGLRFWPFGYNTVPEYVNLLDKETFDMQFVNRNITYFLGNGSGTDNSLNTNDCEAILSGSSRYKRGENIYRYMNLKYNNSHNHKKIISEGLNHNGEQAYKSDEFKTLLNSLLNDS